MKKPEPCPTCKGWCCEHRSPDGAELRYLHMARLAFNHVCPDCETGFVYGPIPTAEDERAAVVAYLRVEADAFERTRTEHGALRAKWLYLTADAIDRGAHCDLKDEKTPMSYDWTKEELLQELNERKAEGESEEMTFDFIWAVVERAYQERDHCKGEAKPMTNEQTILARRLVACKGFRWLPGMLRLRVTSPGMRDYLLREGRVPDGGDTWDYAAWPVIPDLTDAATLGCLLALVREAWNDPAYLWVDMQRFGATAKRSSSCFGLATTPTASSLNDG